MNFQNYTCEQYRSIQFSKNTEATSFQTIIEASSFQPYWSNQFPTISKHPVSNNIEAPSFKQYRSTQFQTISKHPVFKHYRSNQFPAISKHPVSNNFEAPSFQQYRSTQFPSNYWSRQFPSNTSSNINQNGPIEPSLRTMHNLHLWSLQRWIESLESIWDWTCCNISLLVVSWRWVTMLSSSL